MTQSHLKCHNYVFQIILSLPLWTIQMGSYLQWHTQLLYICSKPQTFLNTLHISPLCTAFHLNNWVQNFLQDSRCPGAVPKKTTFRTGTVADLSASHSTWRRHSTFPVGKRDHGQVGKSPSWTLSKPCPAVRVLPFGVREEKTTCNKSNASQ